MLEGYGPIDPETARRLAGNAPRWDRILTHPETGCVLSVGRDSYTPPADMRRYTEIRDQTCQGIGCNRKATTSEIDHTIPWNKGGPTAVGNLVHLCKACHRLKHQSSFSTKQSPTGALTWTSPGGKTYTREPANPIGPPPRRAPAAPPLPSSPENVEPPPF
ncbi:MAG: HNH endonuclease signature motif containing protein [Cryobacterium sp.]